MYDGVMCDSVIMMCDGVDCSVLDVILTLDLLYF